MSSNQIQEMFSSLSEKEKKVLACRYGIGGIDKMTLEEVGNIFGVTRERVRQIEAKAFNKLKRRADLLGFKADDLISG